MISVYPPIGGSGDINSLLPSQSGQSGKVLSTDGSNTSWIAVSGTGTVQSVSVVSANGLAGTVANSTTTPAITLSTSITGILKGDGTGISAATSGTDYAPATSGSSILYGNTAGGFSNVTIGTGLSFTSGTLSSTGVTGVTATSPVASSGGTSPVISLNTGYGDTLNPYASKTANYFLAAPNGTAGVPSFRALVASDVPTLNQNTTGTAANVTGVVAVANGGSGFTTSSGPNSIVLRDADNNITANAYFNGFTSVAASSSLITLTIASTPIYLISGSGGQIIKLPNANTLPNGTIFSFNNNQSSGNITVNNHVNNLVVSIPPGAYTTVVLNSNGTSQGTWDVHDQTPANVSWSTTTLNYPGSITSTTWNGVTIDVPYGGTGVTTLTGIVKGNGTSAFSAATAGTDYQAPITLTTTGTSGAATFVGNTLNIPNYATSSGTVTSVAQSFTGGIISVAGSPVTTSGTLALTVAGTSGGIPYFSSGTTWASSAALAINSLVIGGGAGAAPATTTTGTGVITALGVNTGTAGAFVVNGGVLGTPSSGTVTNLTGTASININGTVGATTPTTGVFTTATARAAATQDSVILQGRAGGTSSYGVTLTPTTLTASRTLTLPDASGTVLYSGGPLGTPSSGTLTNATGLPISTGVSGLGTNVATFLATPSSANLISAITDETGTGLLVFNNAPALTNPTVTNYVETVNAITAGTSATIDLANGTVVTFTISGGNATITMPTAVAGKSFVLILTQDSTPRTVTWTTVVWPSATAPTISTGSGKRDIFSFFSNGTSWFGATIGQNYT